MKNLRAKLIPLAASGFIRLLRRTIRIRHAHLDRITTLDENGRNYIVAFWHGHLLMMIYAAFSRPIHALISQHRDGELIARTMARFGARAVRGSSTRGGSSALKAMIRLAKQRAILAITPDGPKGPRHRVQQGVIGAAQAAGVPIVPIAFVAKKKNTCSRGTASKSRIHSPAPFFCMVSR